VKADMRNRLMDRNHRAEDRYMWLGDDALYVSTVVDPCPDAKGVRRQATDAVFDHDEHAHAHHWHHGGLVNKPRFMKVDAEQAGLTLLASENLESPLLKQVQVPVGKLEIPPVVEIPGFSDAPWEVIPLADILYCERPEDHHHFDLHVHRNDDSIGSLITLELSTTTEAVMDAWVSGIRGKLKEQRRLTDTPAPRPSLLAEWVAWLQFPVRFFVRLTIPDMDNPKLQHLYPLAFVMSMVWLAIFAFSVVKACDGIHADFGISDAVLGFTVAAAGTSFPNVFSGMCVARQGKTSMAVANALGANVQNVFLALAVPWTIQSWFLNHGPFPMEVGNLKPAVAECFITLMPVLLIYLCNGCSMPGWSGGLFLIVYALYLVFAIGQEVYGCAYWPFPCS